VALQLAEKARKLNVSAKIRLRLETYMYLCSKIVLSTEIQAVNKMRHME